MDSALGDLFRSGTNAARDGSHQKAETWGLCDHVLSHRYILAIVNIRRAESAGPASLKPSYPNEGAGHLAALGQVRCRAGAAVTTDLVHLLDQLVARGLAPDILRHCFGLRCNKKVRVSSALVLIE